MAKVAPRYDLKWRICFGSPLSFRRRQSIGFKNFTAPMLDIGYTTYRLQPHMIMSLTPHNSKQLYPGADFSDELGPRVIRDSWRDDHPMHTTIPRPPKVQRRRSISTSQPSQPTIPPPRPPRHSVSLAPLRPYPSGRFPPTETIFSTHLLTQPPSRVHRRTQRQPDGGMEADGESTEYNSSSDVDRVDTLNLTRGRKHLTYRGLESVDDSSASASAVDSQMRFHGKSSLFELIGETMKLKEMHRSSIREEGMRGYDSPRRSPSHTNHRRPEYWTTPPVRKKRLIIPRG